MQGDSRHGIEYPDHADSIAVLRMVVRIVVVVMDGPAMGELSGGGSIS